MEYQSKKKFGSHWFLALGLATFTASGCTQKSESTVSQNALSSSEEGATLGTVGYVNYEAAPRRLMEALKVSLSDTRYTTQELTQLRTDISNFKARMATEATVGELKSTAVVFAKLQNDARICSVAIENDLRTTDPNYRYLLKQIYLTSGTNASTTQNPVSLHQKNPAAVHDFIHRLSRQILGKDADSESLSILSQLWIDTASDLATDPAFADMRSRTKGTASMLCVALASSPEASAF